MKVIIALGVGVLTWNRSERVSDRYGAVYLIEDGQNSFSDGPSPSLVRGEGVKRCAGLKGRLVAHVMQTRDSTHIGDLFRGLSPRTPEVGADIQLGDGEFFAEPLEDGGLAIGVKPADGRKSDWLDPRALYDAHEQTVELSFECNS